MNKKEVMSTLNNSIDSNSLSINSTTDGTINTCWDYWYREYYPQIIYPSYPVYIQDRAKDKGKQAFEIIKMLSDKKMVKLDKVKDFIDLMDILIKIL